MSARIRGDIPFSASPGTRYEHSNFGSAILGRAVANVSGMSYARYVRERILLPRIARSAAADEASAPWNPESSKCDRCR